MPDDSIYGLAVEEFYTKLEDMTDSLVAACNPSPTLFATTATMMLEAAAQAIKEFAGDLSRGTKWTT